VKYNFIRWGLKIEVILWKVRAYGFYSRVVKYHKTNERVFERVSFMIRNIEWIKTVQSTFHGVYCLLYTYRDIHHSGSSCGFISWTSRSSFWAVLRYFFSNFTSLSVFSFVLLCYVVGSLHNPLMWYRDLRIYFLPFFWTVDQLLQLYLQNNISLIQWPKRN
jgi:hypothetical protein